MSVYEDEEGAWQRLVDRGPQYDTVEEKLDDYRPPHVRAADRMIELFRDMPVETPTPPRPIDPLADIALIVRRLTYGQMVELASGLGLPPMTIHRWAHRLIGDKPFIVP